MLYLRRSVRVVIKTGVEDFVLVEFMTNDFVVDCPLSFADDCPGRRWRIILFRIAKICFTCVIYRRH